MSSNSCKGECGGDGCNRCEMRGVTWGLFFGALITSAVWTGPCIPNVADRNICKEACKEVGHSESAFDLQRGCVCSDPYPELPDPTRKWTTP